MIDEIQKQTMINLVKITLGFAHTKGALEAAVQIKRSHFININFYDGTLKKTSTTSKQKLYLHI